MICLCHFTVSTWYDLRGGRRGERTRRIGKADEKKMVGSSAVLLVSPSFFFGRLKMVPTKAPPHESCTGML